MHGQIGESLSDCRIYAVFFAESWQKSTSHHNWQWNCEFSTKSKCPINYCSLRTLLISKKKMGCWIFFVLQSLWQRTRLVLSACVYETKRPWSKDVLAGIKSNDNTVVHGISILCMWIDSCQIVIGLAGLAGTVYL